MTKKKPARVGSAPILQLLLKSLNVVFKKLPVQLEFCVKLLGLHLWPLPIDSTQLEARTLHGKG